MVTVRRSEERGHAQRGWLESYHTFSFADYYDPRHMSFRSLRVINEDWVRGGAGFPTHPHRDMEIVTIVLEGALEHRDSMGTSSVIRPGELQRMTAGRGVTHSEFNHSETEPVHLLQIWIEPERRGLEPGYEQREFPTEERKGRFRLVASRDGREDSLTIHQDAEMWLASVEAGQTVEHALAAGRGAWLHVVRGSVELEGDHVLKTGDAAAVTDTSSLRVTAREPSELLLFDLG